MDIAAGMYALSAVLAALYQRRDSGAGAAIKVSLFDSIMEWMQPLAFQAMSERPLRRAGDRHASIVPYGPYRTADGRVLLAIQNEREWSRLCRDVLGHPEWIDDPRFCRNELRLANRALLEPLIEQALAGLTVAEAEARLDAASLAFARANEAKEVLGHPQIRSRERLLSVPTPAGPADLLRMPFNIEGLEEHGHPVPALGEHTDEILHALGYDDAAIDELRRGRVV